MDPVLIDIETRSAVDLKKEGGYRYAAHPSTELLTVAWIDPRDRSRHLWIPYLSEATDVPSGFLSQHLLDGSYFHLGPDTPAPLLEVTDRPWVAHNAWGFDELVWRAVLGAEAQPVGWIDTDPWSRTAALPGGLSKIGEDLRSGQGKDKLGKSRMLKFSRAQEKKPRLGDLVVIGAYNQDDVELLDVLWKHLQDRPIPQHELPVIEADRRINRRGCRIDIPFAKEVINLAEEAVRRSVEAVAELTGGELKTLEDLRKPAKLKAWIQKVNGRLGKSLARPVLEQLLADWDEDDESSWTIELGDDEQDEMGYETVHIPLVAAKVLQLRFSCLRITSAKAKVALMRVQDGRLRGLLAYGAAHTLRWGGRGVQVQNLPRPKETVPVWELIELYEAEGKLDPDVVSGILKRYGEKIQQKYRDDGLDPPPIATLDDAASALIRGIFLPDEGCFFAAADYNAVELRGVAWLAGEEKLLDYFRKNVDVYSEVAFMTLGRYPKGKKDPIRQLFKVVTLGFIYQMSATALYVYGIANGIDWETSPVTPVQCIETLRTMFPKIAGVGTGKFTPDGKTELREGGIWSDLNRAALSAMKYGESRIPNGKARFEFVNGDLLMYLPSGRPIRYRQARVEWAVPPWEVGKKEPRKKQQIVYRSPRGFWNRLHGGVFCENLTQATCRDFLAEAMVRVEKAGLQVALHVHDEIVASVRNDAYAWLMLHLMTINPDWATDFPLMAEMDTMPRYAKTPPSKKWLSINAENGEYKS